MNYLNRIYTTGAALLALVAITSCADLTKPDGTRLKVVGANVTMPDGTSVNTDTGWKTFKSVANTALLVDLGKSLFKTAGNVVNTKTTNGTTRAANNNAAGIVKDGNATALEESRIEAALEKFRIKNTKPVIP